MGHQAQTDAVYVFIEGLKKGQVGQPYGKSANKINQRNKFKKRK